MNSRGSQAQIGLLNSVQACADELVGKGAVVGDGQVAHGVAAQVEGAKVAGGGVGVGDAGGRVAWVVVDLACDWPESIPTLVNSHGEPENPVNAEHRGAVSISW